MEADTLYEEDFVLWAERQGKELRRLAREGSNLPLDWENIAEEIESLGKRDRREVESLVENILVHLLKLSCSPAEGPRDGWFREIRDFREQLDRVTRDSPSLRARLDEFIVAETGRAARKAREDLRLRGEHEAAREAAPERLRDITPERLLDDEWFLHVEAESR
jgi:hypothetical protein